MQTCTMQSTPAATWTSFYDRRASRMRTDLRRAVAPPAGRRRRVRGGATALKTRPTRTRWKRAKRFSHWACETGTGNLCISLKKTSYLIKLISISGANVFIWHRVFRTLNKGRLSHYGNLLFKLLESLHCDITIIAFRWCAYILYIHLSTYVCSLDQKRNFTMALYLANCKAPRWFTYFPRKLLFLSITESHERNWIYLCDLDACAAISFIIFLSDIFFFTERVFRNNEWHVLYTLLDASYYYLSPSVLSCKIGYVCWTIVGLNKCKCINKSHFYVWCKIKNDIFLVFSLWMGKNRRLVGFALSFVMHLASAVALLT